MKTSIQNLFLLLALLAGIPHAAAQTSFVLSSNYPVASGSMSVAAFTNVNGNTDLVSANYNASSLTVLTNNGSGIFSASVTVSSSLDHPNSVVAVDVNADGKADLICVSQNNDRLSIFTNDGSGGYVFKNFYVVGGRPSAVAAFTNVDGRMDLVTANYNGNSLSVLTNGGSGDFGIAATLFTGVQTPYSVTVADVNNDGALDIICANQSTGSGTTLSVFTNNRSGSFFFSSSPIVGSGPICVTAADINNDGWVDLISANGGSGSGNTLTVLTNNHSGMFFPASTNTVGASVHGVTAADVNKDGWLDLICANGQSANLSVLTNNGSGSFTLATNIPVGNSPVWVVAADVNYDGKLDLIAANLGDATVSVLFNTLPSTTTLTNLVVSPASANVYVSSNQQFTAMGYFSNGSSQTLTSNLVWSSSSTNVASITANGLATGLTNGVTTIKAISGSVSNSTTLTVFAVLTNIVVTPANPTIAISSNQQFIATGLFNDGSVQTLNSGLTWFSGCFTIATINSSGLATGVTNGATTITASLGSVSGNTALTVVAPPAISTQSTNGTISGGNVTLNVGATGGGLSYQWQFNGTNISGATGASLTLTNYSAANVGVYTVVISNAAGSVTSLPIVIATVGIKMFAGVIINGPIGSNYLVQASADLAHTNWTTLTNVALPTQPYVYIDYSTPFNNQQFYRAVPNWTNGLSITPGVNWIARDSNRNWQCVASSADGTKLVAGVYGGLIYTSTDSGVTWTPRYSNNSWWSVASSSDGSKLASVTLNGQIYTSTDSGVTWTPRDSNRNWRAVASSSDGTKLVAVLYPGQIYTSTDSGITWTARETPRYWYSVASSSDGTKLVALESGGNIYTSTDSGVTWTARDFTRYWASVASSSDGTKLVAGVNPGQIYTSTDSGVTWTARDFTRYWTSVTSSSDGTKLVAVVSGGQIYTSADSGVTWTPRANSQYWSSIACSSDGTKFVAVVYGGQIYTSTP